MADSVVAEPDIAAFLRARYDEDEQIARAAATPGPWRVERREDEGGALVVEQVVPEYLSAPVAAYESWGNEYHERDFTHIARHDPARVLADVAAKRQMIDWALDDGEYGLTSANDTIEGEYSVDAELPDRLLRLLALPYAGHPDYREAWRP